MTDNLVKLDAVSVVHVPKHDEISHICTLDSSNLEDSENEDIRSLSEGVVSNIIEDKRYGDARSSPNYGGSKSARIQDIGDDLDQEKEKAIECIKRVRTAEEMAADAKALGRLYKKQSQSRGDALVVASYRYEGIDCAAILKIPYKEEVYQTGEDDVTAAERIIEKDVDKSLIYPAIEPSNGDANEESIKSYQANTSKPSQYWQDFAGLKRSLTPDEELFEQVSRGEEPFVESETIDDLQDRRDDLHTQLLNGNVKVSIGEIEFRTELKNILDPEQFSIERDGNSTRIILQGQRAKVVSKQGRKETSIVSDRRG
ncbi:hypothetical protein [Halostagnicola bangensis]